MSRDILDEQGVEPNPQAWKRFENVVTDNLPAQKAGKVHERALEKLQKDTPPSERISFAGKSMLEAMHVILKLTPESESGEIVKYTLAKYEKDIAAENGDVVKPEIKVPKPEIVEIVKLASSEQSAAETVKPAPKIRNFEAVGREELINELIVAARIEAYTRTGEELDYRLERRLAKMYRQAGDNPPTERQRTDLDSLQERFGKPMPQPKNFIEATVLILDNSTDAEKSARLGGQMIKIDELVKREEAQKTESVGAFGQADECDVFGRTDDYFIRRLHGTKMQPQGKSYYQLTNEAQQRGFLPPQSFNAPEDVQEKQIQQALYQMGIANALQQQVKKSLDEQGISLESSARKIMNATIDNLANQPQSAEEFNKVQEVNRSRLGGGLTAQNKLEAKSYINTYCEEEESDDFSASLASAAAKKAAQIKLQPPQEEIKVERELKRENTNNFDERQTRTRGRSR